MTTRRAYGNVRIGGKVAALVLFALFTVVLLVALAAGVRAYAHLTDAQDQVRTDRFADNLVVNAVRAADAFNAVSAADGPEGPVLVLSQRTAAGTFQTRIYASEGTLYQEYALDEAPLDPKTATPIMQTDTFAFSFADGLLEVTTDQGTACVALRCAQPQAETEATHG